MQHFQYFAVVATLYNTTNQKPRKARDNPKANTATLGSVGNLDLFPSFSGLLSGQVTYSHSARETIGGKMVCKEEVFRRELQRYKGFISSYGHIITDTLRRRVCLFSGVSSSQIQAPSGSGKDPRVPGAEQMDSYPKKRAP